MTSQSPRVSPSPAWLAILASLTGSVTVLLHTTGIAPIRWWLGILATIAALAAAFVITLWQEKDHPGDGWGRVIGYRAVTLLATGAHVTIALWIGPGGLLIALAVLCTIVLAVVGHWCRTPPQRGIPIARLEPSDRRDPRIRSWEHLICTVSGIKVTVTDVKPWADPRDGLTVTMTLPVAKGATVDALASCAANLAGSARLPRGCTVHFAEGADQGTAVAEVSTRNTMADIPAVHTEPTTPASINDDIPVLQTGRKVWLTVCLRLFSMIVGGTTGSGKTTFLHRLIAYLARCVDALIWIVDLNGGGLAEPWVYPWATRRCGAPVVDWIADNEAEAAVMAAVAAAIARGRKTGREAVRRKRSANRTILPVDRDMPAIVIITDEGGEVRQAVSLLGQLAATGITRIAQIGRAEGVRAILSVLRGTSDLTDKGLRVVAALRISLRMEEHDEYTHVLGSTPPKTDLGLAVGAAYLRTPEHPRPILGRTHNLDLDSIDRHAIACAPLRPELDQWALADAAKVTPADILGGREPDEDMMELEIMQDAAQGRAYTARWERYAPKLAEMRGEQLPADARTRNRIADAGSPESLAAAAPALSRLMNSFGYTDHKPHKTATIYQFPTAAEPTVREQIIDLLTEAGPDGMTGTQLEQRITAARSGVYDTLGKLRDSGLVVKNTKQRHVLAELLREAS